MNVRRKQQEATPTTNVNLAMEVPLDTFRLIELGLKKNPESNGEMSFYIF